MRLSARRLWTALQALAFRAGLPSGGWTQRGTVRRGTACSAGLPSAGRVLTSSFLSAGPGLPHAGPISWALLVFLGHSCFDNHEPGSRGSGVCTPQGTFFPRRQAQTGGLSHPRAPQLVALEVDHSPKDKGIRKGHQRGQGQSNPER